MNAVDQQPGPVITMVRGAPTPTELAAVVAVLLAAEPTDAPPTSPAPRSLWADRARAWPVQARPGPGSWRASGLPR